jgi:hypothetical protein
VQLKSVRLLPILATRTPHDETLSFPFGKTLVGELSRFATLAGRFCLHNSIFLLATISWACATN